jgi:hypothetical protein
MSAEPPLNFNNRRDIALNGPESAFQSSPSGMTDVVLKTVAAPR